MNQLEELTNVEKASLLHQLFPKQISPFIEFTLNMCKVIIEGGQQIDNPAKGLLTIIQWMDLIREAENRITTLQKKMEELSALFSTQLFGNLAPFTIFCLLQFTTVRRSPDKKFALAVQVLFGN